jgi:hypothetical protein
MYQHHSKKLAHTDQEDKKATPPPGIIYEVTSRKYKNKDAGSNREKGAFLPCGSGSSAAVTACGGGGGFLDGLCAHIGPLCAAPGMGFP